jgi:putative transposase
MVTCATHLKRPYFAGANRLHLLRETLLNLAQEYGWNLQAWAIFPNHYHFVALSPVKSESLQPFVQKLHANTALSANEWDEAPGRQDWYQYWETHLTFQKSYYARLCYVHRNAVTTIWFRNRLSINGVPLDGFSKSQRLHFTERL